MAYVDDTSGQSAVGGLLSGFANSYMQTKKLQNDQALQQGYLGLQQKNQQMQMLQEGMQDNGSGGVQYNDAGLVKQKAMQAQYQQSLNSNDADETSENSQNKRALTAGAFELLKPGSGNFILNGNPQTGKDYSAADLTAAEPIIKTAMSSDAGMNRLMPLVLQKQDQMDNNIHQKVVSRITNDPQLKQKVTQYNNLSGTLNTVANADHLTPQQFDEFQQAVRANLGIKGNSGVGEREKDYLNDLGLNAARWQEFLTSKPANLNANDPMFQHVKNLAGIELQNIKSQTQNRINAVSAGAGSLYKRRPDLKSDLDDTINASQAQFNASQGGGAQASGPKVGDVENGYIYQGGDPGKQSSWKKQ